MSDRWSESGDILSHEAGTPLGLLIILTVIASIPLFFVSVRVGIVGDLALWSLFAWQGLSIAERTEFDRRSKTMRKRSALGRTWTERLYPFTAVQVDRATSLQGYPRIRVSLTRGDPPDYPDMSKFVVAVYPIPGDSDERQARESGGRLARFLNLPLKVDL